MKRLQPSAKEGNKDLGVSYFRSDFFFALTATLQNSKSLTDTKINNRYPASM